MTKHGEQQLREEILTLSQTDRPRISKMIGEAREHGDLKENAEYHAAKEMQGHNEARIVFLESQLKNAQIIDVNQFNNDGKVIFGSTITLLNLNTNKKMSFRIVGEHEANIDQGKLSYNSPIARGCIGKRLDDVAEIETPQGTTEYEICQVDYI